MNSHMKIDLFLVLYTSGGIILVGMTYLILGLITETISAANKKKAEEEARKKKEERDRKMAA